MFLCKMVEKVPIMLVTYSKLDFFQVMQILQKKVLSCIDFKKRLLPVRRHIEFVWIVYIRYITKNYKTTI